MVCNKNQRSKRVGGKKQERRQKVAKKRGRCENIHWLQETKKICKKLWLVTFADLARTLYFTEHEQRL